MSALELTEYILEQFDTEDDFSLWLENRVLNDLSTFDSEDRDIIVNLFKKILTYSQRLFPADSPFFLVAETYIEWLSSKKAATAEIFVMNIFWQKVVEFSVNNYRQRLIFYTSRKLIYPSMAEDVVQDSFKKLSIAVPGDIKRNVLGWLYRTSSNRAVDINRKEERKSLVDHSVMEKVIPDTQDSPYNSLIKGENKELLKEALQELLNSTQQELIKLKYEDQLSSKEIAEVTGLSDNYVRKATCLTFMVLRKKLPEWLRKRQ